MAPSNDVEQFRSVLRKARSIVAIAGAGLSAASGSITFKLMLSLSYSGKSALPQAYQPLGVQEVSGGRMMP